MSDEQRDAMMTLCEAATALSVALDGKGYIAERTAVLDALKAIFNSGVFEQSLTKGENA